MLVSLPRGREVKIFMFKKFNLVIWSLFYIVSLGTLGSNQKQDGCPVVLETYATESSDQLYYFIVSSHEHLLKLKFVDQEGIHDTGVNLEYLPEFNTFSAIFSPTGKHLAIIFFNIEGDPSILLEFASITLINLESGRLSHYPVKFKRQYFDNTLPFTAWWGWEDDYIYFNLEERVILNTNTGGLNIINYPKNPWLDNELGNNEHSYIVPYLSTYQYIAFARNRPDLNNLYVELAIVDIKTGEIFHDKPVIKWDTISYPDENYLFVFENTYRNIEIIASDKKELIIPYGWAEYRLDGLLIPNTDVNYVAFHTDNFIGDDRVYVLQLLLDGSSHAILKSLCQTGFFHYPLDMPSWSSDNHYQFLILNDSKYRLFTYNPANNHLSLITEFERLMEGANIFPAQIYIIGWKSTQ